MDIKNVHGFKGYGWKISKLSGDFWAHEDKAKYVGWGANTETEDEWGWVNRIKWRVLDADREIYAYGFLWGNYWTCEPLDEWAMGDLGCTRIQIKTSEGKWEDVV